MNSFKKLTLVTAIAVTPFSANAFEPLDDEMLSDVTGQAGITITLDSLNVSIDELTYTDTDGHADKTQAGVFRMGTAGNAGDSTSITSSGAVTIGIDIGSATTSASDTSLFVDLGVSGLSVDLGSISLEDTNGNGGSFGDVALTGLTLNDTLLEITPGGASGQGITLTQGDLGSFSAGFSFTDDGNSLSADVALSGLDLSGTTIDVENTGLVIGMQGLNTDVSISNINLGNGASIGNINITGLAVTNTNITVAGH